MDVEKQLITAIKGLTRRVRVKPEYLEIIKEVLSNPKFEDRYREIFINGKNTQLALNEGIYTPDMVRLLTLRAMVIPETLPEFLAWIGKEGKQQESKQVSDTFQAEIKKSLRQVSGQGTNLISRVYQGVVSIIPRLIKQPQLLDSVVWLLSSDKGLWGYFYSRQVKSEIDNDLSSMRYYGRGKQGVDFKLVEDKEWQKIFNEIQVYWRYRSGRLPEYQPLAELFSQLRNYQLSALFYHICSGVVPKEVFYKLTRRGFRTQVYKVTVKRHIDFYEYLWITTVTIGGVKLKAIVVFFILLSGFLMGGVSSKLFLISDSEKSINKITGEFTNAYNFSGFNGNVDSKKVKNEIISLLKDNPQEITNLKDFQCVVADNLDLIEESCPISQNRIAEAKQSFAKSKEQLIKIEQDIKFHLNTNYDQEIQNAENNIKLKIESFYKKSIENIDKQIAELKQKKQIDEITGLKELITQREDIKKEKNEKVKKIKETIKQVIKVNQSSSIKLQNCVIFAPCPADGKEEKYQEDWIKAIYSYQQTKKLNPEELKPDGILGEETADKLKEEIKQKLKIS